MKVKGNTETGKKRLQEHGENKLKEQKYINNILRVLLCPHPLIKWWILYSLSLGRCLDGTNKRCTARRNEKTNQQKQPWHISTVREFGTIST